MKSGKLRAGIFLMSAFLMIAVFTAASCAQTTHYYPPQPDSGLPADGGSQSDGGSSDPADALWNVITLCINTSQTDYCECQPMYKTCCSDTTMPNDEVVWALDDDYVAIQGTPQCGCPQDFVSGLVLPRTKITGIEDPKRPNGIWQFAWDEAVRKISNQDEIGLTINPVQYRSQNQMHIHIQRITSKTRIWFDDPNEQQRAANKYDLVFLDLSDLSKVFTVVKKQVGESEMRDTGVMVVGSSGGNFQAMITHRRSPESFVEKKCAK